MKIAIIMVLIINLDGDIQHKTTVKDECPDMNVISAQLEKMKTSKAIRDYGAVCIPAEFEEVIDGIPL
tara:strand:- start:1468 stop:1671 length:204 start_codon:yes stop_codon:yes gene_type:complete